jgi:hypothetical protein
MHRFDHYRLLERVRIGRAGPVEIAAASRRFDNHCIDSPHRTRRTARPAVRK